MVSWLVKSCHICMCFTTWSSGTWGMLHAISKRCAMAPSHTTDWLLWLFLECGCGHKRCQNWEKVMGKGRAKEEPEGEVIVGPRGEAVEQSSYNAPSFLFFSKSNYLSNHTPLVLNGFIASFFFWPDWDILLYVWVCLTCRWVGGGRGDWRDQSYQQGRAHGGGSSLMDAGGGFQCWQKRRHRGCCTRYSPLLDII